MGSPVLDPVSLIGRLLYDCVMGTNGLGFDSRFGHFFHSIGKNAVCMISLLINMIELKIIK